MKATVDKNTCIGCGLCASDCPEVFSMNDDLRAGKDGEARRANPLVPHEREGHVAVADYLEIGGANGAAADDVLHPPVVGAAALLPGRIPGGTSSGDGPRRRRRSSRSPPHRVGRFRPAARWSACSPRPCPGSRRRSCRPRCRRRASVPRDRGVLPAPGRRSESCSTSPGCRGGSTSSTRGRFWTGTRCSTPTSRGCCTWTARSFP